MEIKMQRKDLPNEDPAAAPQTSSFMGGLMGQSPVPAGVPTPATSGLPNFGF